MAALRIIRSLLFYICTCCGYVLHKHTLITGCTGRYRQSAVSDIDSHTILKKVAQQREISKANAKACVNSAVSSIKKGNFDGGASERIVKAFEQLELGLIEREVEVKLLVLAAIAGEHVLLIGPPGTGKSELGRRLATISGGRFFERLLTKYTNPEELFGPLSLASLERDEYVRQTDGYLPTANVAFLDEVFKANSAILNSLLTLLNERLFDNGNKRCRVPLIAVVGASNELPESEELDALYDRFLLRKFVRPVSDDAIFELLRGGQNQSMRAISQDREDIVPLIDSELSSRISDLASSSVLIPLEVMSVLKDCRMHLRDETQPPVYVSDRRLVKAARLLRICAVTNGRAYVSTLDCLVLQHVLWSAVEDQEPLRQFILKRAVPDPGLKSLKFLVSGLVNRIMNVKDSTAAASSSSVHAAVAAAEKEFSLMSEVLSKKAAEYRVLAEECSSGVTARKGNLWLSEEDKKAAQKRLTPLASGHADDLESLLATLLALQDLLVSRVSAGSISDTGSLQGGPDSTVTYRGTPDDADGIARFYRVEMAHQLLQDLESGRGLRDRIQNAFDDGQNEDIVRASEKKNARGINDDSLDDNSKSSAKSPRSQKGMKGSKKRFRYDDE